MPDISRRSLLAGTAAMGTASVVSAAMKPEPKDGPKGELSMAGQSVLITGCSSGFGRLAAERFARLGAKVFATMRNLPRPEGEELKQLASDEKLDLHVLELDVLLDEHAYGAVGEAERINGGPLDILINNAGIGITSPVEVQDMEATKLIFDTNVYGCHRMARAVLPGMRAKKSGLIFNISSQLGRVIVPYSGHYSATKFAVEAMSEQLAYEMVPHGIDVCIIEPGGYPTKVWVNRNRYSKELKDRASPVHTDGYPELVARMGQEDGSGRSADPMDVPNAMARIITMPAGTRPLRTAVHPGRKPQLPINEVTARVQTEWLGQSRIGPMVRAVHD